MIFSYNLRMNQSFHMNEECDGRGRRATRKPFTGSAWLMLLLMAMLLSGLTGCSSSRSPMASLIESLSPQTPGEVARDAFNVYDADVRRNSVNALSAARFGGEEPYLRLYRLLIDDPDPTVRAACTKALGLHGQVQDIDLVLIRLKDEATTVRWEAAKALQKLHHPKVIDPLMDLLARDEDADVRQAAAIALGQYPAVSVFNQLVGALDDRSFSVVQAARQSLVLLTGYDFGTDGSLWLIYARNDPQNIFKHQKQYTWQPYVAPRTFGQKMAFWKKPPPPPQPRVPTGMTPLAEEK